MLEQKSNQTETRLRRICIPINEDHDSMLAIDWALQNLINCERDEVILLHVRPDIDGKKYSQSIQLAKLYGVEPGNN